MKHNFTLTKMKRMKNGKRENDKSYVWYYYVWDSDGKRRKYSTGLTRGITEAQNYCEALLKKGKLIPQRHNKAFFRTLVKDFYDPQKSPYLREKRTRGAEISKSSLNIASLIFKNHILPFFGDMLVSSITKRDIEEWVGYLKGKKISNRTINNYLAYLKQIFHYLKSIEVVSTEPTEGYVLSIPAKRVRDILTDNEVKDLMNEASIDSYWQGNRKMYLANLISCLTGMRIAEIYALKEENINENFINITHSFNPYDGLKPPKNGKPRKVPIPRRLYEMLKEIFPKDKGFIFLDNGKPDFESKPRRFLYDALAIMGISEKERKERNICFHSWRHWFNSKLVRSNINSSKIKKVIGHTEKGNDMTSLYTHFFAEDFQDIVEIQTEILESFREREVA